MPMENNNGYTEYVNDDPDEDISGVSDMSSLKGMEEIEIKQLLHDNQILAQNVYDLQKQLQESYKKIKELIDSYS